MSLNSLTKLGSILNHAHKRERLDPRDELTKNAQQLVSQSFYGTLLKQASKSPFHSEEFEGGRGGEAFQELFNQKLAEHMARGAGSKLVRPLVHKLQAGRAYQKHKSTHSKGHHVHGLGSGQAGKASPSTSQFLSHFVGA
ncbi:MAG: hypothetical protein JO353_00285 [Phycisphaerae bacterium]|nr:hypothetical protein [Phycisphaerae bacterium]